jgi:Cys-rich four helix bundle protein (predicted Tat secretion target)
MNYTKPPQFKITHSQINRRELLLGLGAAASTFALSGNAVAEKSNHDHSTHSAKMPAVLDAATNCINKGNRCIAHCLSAWKEGNLDLAECASKVYEMNAICGAFTMLLASNSSYVKEYAVMCASVCKECADECRKHDDHLECRECAEACEELIKAIETEIS